MNNEKLMDKNNICDSTPALDAPPEFTTLNLSIDEKLEFEEGDGAKGLHGSPLKNEKSPEN